MVVNKKDIFKDVDFDVYRGTNYSNIIKKFHCKMESRDFYLIETYNKNVEDNTECVRKVDFNASYFRNRGDAVWYRVHCLERFIHTTELHLTDLNHKLRDFIYQNEQENEGTLNNNNREVQDGSSTS